MPDITQLNLMIVDDDEFAIELFLCALEELEIQTCETACSGQEALALVESRQTENPLDLIICDIEMPDMDGLALLRHLAEVDFDGKVAVISGLDSDILRMARDLGKAHNLDVLGAIQKPIQKEALALLLDQVINEPFAPKSKPFGKRSVSADAIQFGLDNDEFTLFFQPKVNVKSQCVFGAEALIRWFSSEFGGIVGPDEFIPQAEESSLINAITERVIDMSIQELKRFKAEGHRLKLSINVSMLNLSQLDFATNLAAKLKNEAIDPSDIILEITETALIRDATNVLEVLTRLKILGICLSIDDFGTGYSSMSQLQHIPFSELKIDRSFVYGAGENDSTRRILESSASLAQQLAIASVAEGVETREDWDRVSALGIDLVQGYFISKPLPPEDFSTWLREWNGLTEN
ncbi:MAG: EAL domain-containing response regulator [Pseudomonadales bacterium]|nr:EAL domain-containing response regulator [Pseudomonadales bacterium]